MMHKKKKRIAILMDEIDGMNNGDKGGITELIKLIRQKKTKKQKLESVTMNPIICVSNYYIDKKIRELMKVCHVFELKIPTNNQISKIMNIWCPTLSINLKDKLIKQYINGDFRKMVFIRNLIEKGKYEFVNYLIGPEFQNKFYNEDSKKITKNIFYGNYTIREHERFMNETDRTIVALLWHENVPDIFIPLKKQTRNCTLQTDCYESPVNTITSPPFNFYYQLLQNMCFADYIDRITFQNQVWVFNEMSSLIKTFYNQYLLNNYCSKMNININIKEIRFTKILTKYSTEYNNIVFIYNLCQQLQIDKKDMFSLFQELLLKYGENFFNLPELLFLFEKTEITKLDLKRIIRFLQKKLKTNVNEDLVDDDDDDKSKSEETID